MSTPERPQIQKKPAKAAPRPSLQKFFLVLVVLALTTCLALTAIAWIGFASVKSQVVQELSPPSRIMTLLPSLRVRMADLEKDYWKQRLVAPDKLESRGIKPVQKSLDEIDADILKENAWLSSTKEIRESFEQLRAKMEELKGALKKDIKTFDKSEDPAEEKVAFPGKMRDVRTLLDGLAEAQNEAFVRSSRKATQSWLPAEWAWMGAIFLQALLWTGLAYWFRKKALRPLKEFSALSTTLVKNISSGKADDALVIKDFNRKLPFAEYAPLADQLARVQREFRRNAQSTQSILAGLEDAVFFFEKGGKLLSEHSEVTQKYFKSFSGIKGADRLFASVSGQAPDSISKLIDMIFADDSALDFDSVVSLLPQSIRADIGEESPALVKLIYRAIKSGDGKVQKVCVIGRNVDSEERLKIANQSLSTKMSRIQKVAANIVGYESFCEDMDEMFAAAEKIASATETPPAESLGELKRILHTLKGSLYVFDFSEPATVLHELESNLGLLDTVNEVRGWLGLQEDFLAAKASYSSIRDDIAQTLALTGAKLLRIPKAKVDRLVTQLKRGRPEDLEAAHELERVPLSDVYAKYQVLIEKTCEKLGKDTAQLVFDESADQIMPSEARMFDACLPHLIRNSCDHGIEYAELREERAKPVQGTVRISFKRMDSCLLLSLSDDGGGIPVDKLAAKAVRKGMWTEAEAAQKSDAEKLQLIFAEEFSTSEQASEVSGRGVGMDAVRTMLTRQGGDVVVHSKIGEGTRFDLSLPLSKDNSESPSQIMAPRPLAVGE